MKPLGSKNSLKISVRSTVAKSRPKQVIQNQSYSLIANRQSSFKDSSSDVCEDFSSDDSISPDLKTGTQVLEKQTRQELIFLSQCQDPNRLILVDPQSQEIIWLNKTDIESP